MGRCLSVAELKRRRAALLAKEAKRAALREFRIKAQQVFQGPRVPRTAFHQMRVNEYLVRCFDGIVRPFPRGLRPALIAAFAMRADGIGNPIEYENGAVIQPLEKVNPRGRFDPRFQAYIVLRPASVADMPPLLIDAPEHAYVEFWDPSVTAIPWQVNRASLIEWDTFTLNDGQQVVNSILYHADLRYRFVIEPISPGHWSIRRNGKRPVPWDESGAGVRVYVPKGPSPRLVTSNRWESFGPGESRIIEVPAGNSLQGSFKHWAAHRGITWHMRFRTMEPGRVKATRFTEAEESLWRPRYHRPADLSYDSERRSGDNPWAIPADIAAERDMPVERWDAEPEVAPIPDAAMRAEVDAELAESMGWTEAERRRYLGR
jgi:hypothetical protein